MSIDELCGLSVTALKITPLEFWQSTPNEIYDALDVYFKLELEDKKDRWKLMRLQTFYLLNIHLSEDHLLETPQDLFKFKWEEEVKTKLKNITPEFWDALDKI